MNTSTICQVSPQPKSSPQQPQPAAAAPSTTSILISPFHAKYSHLNLPNYVGPQFHAEVSQRSGSLVITGDVSGIISDDISITPDVKSRSLTIQGVRLPMRRHTATFGGMFGMPTTRNVQPFGYFKKVIQLSGIDPHQILDLNKLEAVVNLIKFNITRYPSKRVVLLSNFVLQG